MTDKETGDLWTAWGRPKAPEPASGEALRDAGIAKVAEHHSEWLAIAYKAFCRFVEQLDRGFTSEEFRSWSASYGVPLPTNSNAWGSVISTAARRGMIVDTGMQRKATRPSAHARRLPVWRKA